jgi:hypothetical protein
MRSGIDRCWLKTVFAVIIVWVSTCMGVSLAAAAENVVFPKYTRVEFTDQQIDGTTSRPDESIIRSRKRLFHESLIKIRPSFKAEILKSGENL